MNGLTSLLTTSSLASGHAICPFGGKQIDTGIDTNGNGILDSDEIISAQTQIICDAQQGVLSLGLIGRYESGVFGKSAAEIVDYHVASHLAFVVNAQSGMVDAISLESVETQAVDAAEASTLSNLEKVYSLDVATDAELTGLGSVNSISIYGDLLAAAVERADDVGNATQGNGVIAFYQLSDVDAPSFIKTVNVGALPDNVVFTHDGTKVIIANEGEPNDAYTVDPEGSISIIEVVDNIPADIATLITFNEFDAGNARHDELSDLIKLNGPGASVSEDLEPEYIAVSKDNQYAYVSLQENNAIAVINLADNTVEAINALGLKDYGKAGNEIDASDKDDAINITAYEGVYGMYQPDTIASYQWRDQDFIVTANEGDARDYDGFSEEERAEDLLLEPNHPQILTAQDKTQLGRLKITTSMGDDDGDGDMDKIVSYGARSFSIWTHDGQQVFDSASQFERITAAILGDNFNNHNEESKGDSRSDDKGPEPEALAIGEIGDKKYAFIGLERTGGFMVYDITNPFDVSFIDYVINRDFDIDFEIDGDDISGQPELAGDLGPEGMKFIGADMNLTGKPLLVIGNEVSGTTSVYQLDFNQ
ncbi:choice-of-anchor I family protein [Shewanella sp. 1_MG-2023]|uniref:choice-of-anchor I family protein n=1 Tax=unclassified Shewanella TaxID=196818 RepID=UPI0026E3F41A|nr:MULTISPECIES: choice-of-anchor I family protein [unclassified Shewanella]MDO6610906.1 choice-of-anchor I family protein [Shewanella sp. 7_MG-2023]MDO6770243.1 choice-of-anchor I family protein [Shewanella sp. 2_MG-2023]MDO6793384.1 choice-of-anchor I family protein [Shewanella sp. 1_MG-2023]